jgi:hypothetical protein
LTGGIPRDIFTTNSIVYTNLVRESGMFIKILLCAIAILILSPSLLLAQEADSTVADTTKNFKFAGIPIVNYDRTFELYVGGILAAYYKVNKADTISPMSTTGIAGLYTTNKSWFLSAYQLLYLDEDKWRLLAAVASGTVFLQYYAYDPGGGGGFVDYNTEVDIIFLHPERMVYKDLYLGVIGAYVRARTEFDYIDPSTGENLVDRRNLNNLGFSVSYDSKDFVYNPSKGLYWTYKNKFFRDWLGSDNDFNKHEIELNSFFSLEGDKQILATRFYAAIASGDVPFQGQTTVGGDDIRGYSDGKYRDEQVYAIQAEYRRNIYKKFGMVGFFGLASAVPNLSEIPNRKILPGGGIGFRYLMVAEEKINVGIDIAVGNDDWSLSFRIGESFGKK